MQPMSTEIILADALAAAAGVAVLFYALRGLGRLPIVARLLVGLVLVVTVLGSFALALLAVGHGGAELALRPDWSRPHRDGQPAPPPATPGSTLPQGATATAAGDGGLPTSVRGAAAGGVTAPESSAERAAEPAAAALSSAAVASPPATPAAAETPRDVATEPVPAPGAARVAAVPPGDVVAPLSAEPRIPDPETTNLPRPAPRPAEAVAPSAPVSSKATEAAPAGLGQGEGRRVPVLFGTDRAVSGAPGPETFGAERGGRLQLGLAMVAGGSARPHAGAAAARPPARPWVARVVADAAARLTGGESEAHTSVQALEAGAWIDAAKADLAASRVFGGQALVFVHGYNTSLEAALARAAEFAREAAFDGLIVVYSWPSEGRIASYSHDRDSARQAERYLHVFLADVMSETGAKVVHVLAEGIGADPALAALVTLKGAPQPGLAMGQIFLAGPDVDDRRLRGSAAALKGSVAGITLYAAAGNRALAVARRFHGGIARAGDLAGGEPVVADGMESIDATAAAGEASSGGAGVPYAASPLVADMAAAMRDGHRPPDARATSMRRMAATRGGGTFWRWAAQ